MRRRWAGFVPDALVVLVALAQQTELWTSRRTELTPAIVLASMLSPAALLLRRRWPLSSVLVTFVAFGIGVHLMPDGMGTSFLAFLVAAVVTGTMLGTTGRVGWCAGTVIAAQLAFLEPTVSGGGLSDFLTTTLVFTVCWTFGLLLARRPHERAQEQARLREREQVAAEAERVRLTREVHDVLAHGLTVVVVQTVAARAALRAGAAGTDLEPRLGAVEDSARASLAELRHLLRALRDSEDPGSAGAVLPGVQDLPTLVAGITQTGVHVGVSVAGREVALDDGRGLAVYRMVQESLTNALKHANATAIEVRLDYADDALHVVVSDNGRPTRPDPEVGHGLTGMRERVAAYGGTVDVGCRTDGGFAVEAVVPYPQATS